MQAKRLNFLVPTDGVHLGVYFSNESKLVFSQSAPSGLTVGETYPAERIPLEIGGHFSAMRGQGYVEDIAKDSSVPEITIRNIEKTESRIPFFRNASAIYKSAGGRMLLLSLSTPPPTEISNMLLVDADNINAFKPWFNQMRRTLGYKKQDLADIVGVTPSAVDTFMYKSSLRLDSVQRYVTAAFGLHVEFCGIRRPEPEI